MHNAQPDHARDHHHHPVGVPAGRAGSRAPDTAGGSATARPGTAAALEAERAAAALRAASDFIERIGRLDAEGVRAYIRRWHEGVVAEGEAWFVAEAAVAEGVVRSGRRPAQQALLLRMAQTITNRVWYRPSVALELALRATEPSGQYPATLAMIALLVRDHLDPADFAHLYAPFTDLIPLDELGRA